LDKDNKQENFSSSDKLYWLAFSFLNGLGPKRFSLLKDYFGSAQKVWEASSNQLLAIGLNPQLVKNLIELRSKVNLNSCFLRMREKNIECQISEDKNYPENLKKIDSPPFILFSKGAMKSQDSLAIAIVGSRMITDYGRMVTKKLVRGLVAKKITIVSGLARGIDTVAHETALANNGRTIAVLGHGLDLIYPPENKNLATRISSGCGVLVSEYPLGCQPIASNFPARNRIISGLSLGVLVIEANIHSGSLITAKQALDQGREVFAVPGPINSSNSSGTAFLIKQGAKLVENVNDILEELNISL